MHLGEFSILCNRMGKEEFLNEEELKDVPIAIALHKRDLVVKKIRITKCNSYRRN